ncbi:MAG TPA: cupin domain-containing protein [Rhodanobacteraceae bacterium]|nr:cupin domain-containing protein [Rhodanobacteraceae bacterium]
MTRSHAIAFALAAGLAGATAVQAADAIVRKELGVAEIGARTVGKVDAREIEFKPRQQTGRHRHPCPVVGYIVSGTVSFEVEGQPMKTLQAGEVFYEPANTTIVHFDNASKTDGLKFIAYYLLKGDEKSLIEMLPAK